MKLIPYTAKDAVSHKKVGRVLQELPEGDYVISVKKNKPIRSLKANSYYHLVWNIYAIHTGHYIDELKKEFYDHIGFYDLFEDSRGVITRRYKSSAKCDKTEMAALINQQLEWGRHEFPEVIIPRLEDTTYLQWMEIENQYNKTFSGW